MQFVFFVHSIESCWNHGNAHFLRGILRELKSRGHDLRIFEPSDGWSRINLLVEGGEEAVQSFRRAYPGIRSRTYNLATLDLDKALDGADVVIAHEWNDPELIARLGQKRAQNGRFRLLFHDTHHRIVSAPHEMARFNLSSFDGVLAFGEVIREQYMKLGWTQRAWTWHEAADTRIFRPYPEVPREEDVVWIGNWGDNERTAELESYLFDLVRQLGLSATVYGVHYPESAKRMLAAAKIHYAGWLPNHLAPDAFAKHRLTVHIPRRPYVKMLPGIPAIRVFEALACGIPLISSPWNDEENLFRVGTDFLMAKNQDDMRAKMAAVVNDPYLSEHLAMHGLETIRARHTCAHRVDELLSICRTLGVQDTPAHAMDVTQDAQA